jgi:hypothetical protein
MRRLILLVVVSALMLAMSAGTALADQARLLPGVVCLHERSPAISGIVIDGFPFACNLSAPPDGEEVPL